MIIGIICAGDREVAPFLNELQEAAIVDKARLKFHVGKIGNHDVVTLFSGVCKVNAAIATQILIDHFNVEIVINSGVAGGIDSKLKILDTVIATEVAYHDVDAGILTEFHPWMKSVFFQSDDLLLKKSREILSNMQTKGKLYWGRMVTGEAFITDEGRQEIIDTFSPLSVDMETGSIAHVCYANSVPFLSIRSITDTADHSGSENFEKNCEEAANISKEVTLALIEKL